MIYLLNCENLTVGVQMFTNRFAMLATAVAVLISAGTMPAFAESETRTVTARVAPLPALGAGLPGLVVLLGGLFVVARRRRG
jgi:hypothetical protein